MNDINQDHLIDLLSRFVINDLAPQEAEKLDAWVNSKQERKMLFTQLTDVSTLEIESAFGRYGKMIPLQHLQ